MSANPINSSAAGGGPGPSINPELSKISFDDDDLVWVQDEHNRNWFPGEVIKENTADKTYDIKFNQEDHPSVPIDRISEFELDLGDDVIVLNEEEDKFTNNNFKNGKISVINDKNLYNLDKDKYDVIYDDNIREANIILTHLAETDAQMLLNKGLFTSDFFKSIVTEFEALGEEAVSELAREAVQLDTEEKIVEYIVSPVKMVKIYPYAPRNVDWYFKRFLAGDYKKFISIIKQVYSDAVDRGNIIRLPNDNENRYRFKDKPAGLLKYYDYINELVDSLKSNPNE